MSIGAEVQRHASTLLSPLQNVLSDILPGSRESKGIGYFVLYCFVFLAEWHNKKVS